MITRLSLALCCAFGVGSAYGNDAAPPTPAGGSTPVAAAAKRVDILSTVNNEIFFAAGVGTQSYHELDDWRGLPGYLDSEAGTLPALRFEAKRQGDLLGVSNVFTSVSVTALAGAEHYTGYAIDQSAANGLGGLVSFYDGTFDVDVALKLGRAFRPTARLQFIPYVELGFHDWLRGAGGVENYRHAEGGAGLLSQFAVTSKLVASVDVMAGRTFGAHQAALRNSDISTGLGGSTYKRIGVGLDYAYSDRWHLNATYQYASFKYGKSALTTGKYQGMQGEWYEPASTTKQNLVMVGASYVWK